MAVGFIMLMINRAPAESLLCTLLLSFTLGAHWSRVLANPVTTGAPTAIAVTETTVEDKKTTEEQLILMDSTTAGLALTTEDFATKAPTSSGMRSMSYAPTSNADSLIGRSEGPDAATHEVSTTDLEMLVTAEPATPAPNTEGPDFTATHDRLFSNKFGFGPTTEDSTPIPGITLKALTQGPAGLGLVSHPTKAILVDALPTIIPQTIATPQPVPAVGFGAEHSPEPSPADLPNLQTSLPSSSMPHKLPDLSELTTTSKNILKVTLAPVFIQEKEQPATLLYVCVTVVLAVAVCVGIIISMLIRWNRGRTGMQVSSGTWSSQRSKRKKGKEEDTWAGPVKLAPEREDCEDGDNGEEAEGGDMEAEPVLSTFISNEPLAEKGRPEEAVGRPGSNEAKRWEQEMPLLYIDENIEEDFLRLSNEAKFEGGNEGWQGSEEERKEPHMPGEMNGGAFCVTTAV